MYCKSEGGFFSRLLVVSIVLAATQTIAEEFPTISTPSIVTRDEWVAQPPYDNLTELELPVKKFIIAHTGTENCVNRAACVFKVRTIQTYHMEAKHFDDIAWNFLIGGDGAIYEGRGWDSQGAHTKGYNYDSIGIALIGTFTRESPVQKQFDALSFLIEEGVRLGKVSENYLLYPQRAFFSTTSPGDRVIEVIKEWPHYSTVVSK